MHINLTCTDGYYCIIYIRIKRITINFILHLQCGLPIPNLIQIYLNMEEKTDMASPLCTPSDALHGKKDTMNTD